MLTNWGIWNSVKHPRSLVLHQDNGLELILVLRGEITWQVGSKVEIVRPDTIFFTLPSDLHGGPGLDHSGIELLFLLFEVKEQQLKDRTRLTFPRALGLDKSVADDLSEKLPSAESHQVPASALFKSAFSVLVNGMSDGSLEPSRKKTLATMVLEEFRHCLNNPLEAKSSESEYLVRNFVRRLREHCEEDWNVANMAARCELGKSQFTELVKHLYGHSPMQLLTKLRLEKAQDLLLGSDDTVTEIAFKCGFNSSQYFATVFRQAFGVSPTAFISKNRKSRK